MKSHRSAPAPSAPRRPLVGALAALLLAVAALAWWRLTSSARAAPEVVTLVRPQGVDEEVVALVAEHVRRASEAPRDAELRATLAMVYEANELWDEARRSWEGALALAPDRPDWRYHLAICTRQAGESEAALEILREVVSQRPELAAARHRLGDVLLEWGDPEGAAREFEAVIALAPNAAIGYVGLAEALLPGGAYQRAAELCERALGLSPGYKRAHYNLGLAYRGLGRLAEAADELNKGLEAKKEFLSDPLSERIETYRTSYTVRLIEAANLEKGGRVADAARILEPVIARHPDDVNALNNLAACYIQLGRIDEAIGLLQRARNLEPAQFATYINLATAELARRNALEALAMASEAVERAPAVGRTFFVRGRALAALERWGEAYIDLKKSIALDATNAHAYLVLGDSCLRLEVFSEAVEHYAAAVRMIPRELMAHTGLALAALRAGDLPRAKASWQRARELAPEHPLVVKIATELQDAER